MIFSVEETDVRNCKKLPTEKQRIPIAYFTTMVYNKCIKFGKGITNSII